MPVKLYDEKWMRRTFTRMAETARTLLRPGARAALVGVRTRGAEMADRLAAELRAMGTETQVGYLDPTMFRDDLSTGAGLKDILPTAIDFDLNGAEVILVDDVLLTGRSVRAAMEALFHYGRPGAIRLCVMVDRGGRELPIQPDICGMRIDVSEGAWVRVKLRETDKCEDAVYVMGAGDEEP